MASPASTAQVLSSASKSGQTWSLLLDSNGTNPVLYVFNSQSTNPNGYLGYFDSDGSWNVGGAKYGPGGVSTSSVQVTASGLSVSGPSTFTANGTSVTPVAINGITGQAVDLFQVNATSGGTKYVSVNATGKLIGQAAHFTGRLEATNASSDFQLALYDTSGATPNKYLRANGTSGNLEFVNSTFTTVIATLSDTGLFTSNGVLIPFNQISNAGSNQATIGVDASGFLTFRIYNANGAQFQNATGSALAPATAFSFKASSATNTYTTLGINPAAAASQNTYAGPWYDSGNNVLRIDALSGGVAWRNILLSSQGGAKVGIGALFTPGYPLEVNGSIRASGGGWIYLGGIAAPSAPTLSSVAGGTAAQTTYYVKITYSTTNTGGGGGNAESVASAEASYTVPANSQLVVNSPVQPALGAAVNGWCVYVSTTSGSYSTGRQAAGIAIGTNWTMPTTGLVSGAAIPPWDNSAGAIYWSNGMTIDAGTLAKVNGTSASTAAFTFANAGSLNSLNPFWNGYHFLTPDVLTQAGVNKFPLVSFFNSYTTIADPTDLTFNIQTGNQGTLPYHISLTPTSGGLVKLNAGTTITGQLSVTSTSTSSITGALQLNGASVGQQGDLGVVRNDGTGAIYFSKTASNYIYFDGSHFAITNDLKLNNSLYGATSATVSGTLSANSINSYTQTDGQAVRMYGRSSDNFSQIIGYNNTGATFTGSIQYAGDGTMHFCVGSSLTDIFDLNSSSGATITGNATIQSGDLYLSAAGTATSTNNYGSREIYLQMSGWTGSAAAPHSWKLYSDGNANLVAAYDATFPFTVSSTGTVTAQGYIATSSGILLSYNGAAAGTGFYHDASNAAIRTAGSIYFQGANGSGSANIAQVGSITANGSIYINPGSSNSNLVLNPQGTATSTSGAYSSNAIFLENSFWNGTTNAQNAWYIQNVNDNTLAFQYVPSGGSAQVVARLFSGGNATGSQSSAEFYNGLIVNTYGGGASQQTLGLYDATANAANPWKFLRVAAGTLQICNSAFSSAIWQLDDAGNVTQTGGITLNNGAHFQSTSSAGSIAIWSDAASSQNWIESGNAAWNGSIDLNLSGYSGNNVNNLNLKANTTQVWGNLNCNQGLTLTSGGGPGTTLPFIGNDGSGSNGVNLTIPTASTLGWRFFTYDGTLHQKFQLGSDGTLTAASAIYAMNGAAFRSTPGTATNASGDAVFGLTSQGANYGYVGITGAGTGGAFYVYANGSGSASTATFSANGDLSVGGNFFPSGVVQSTSGNADFIRLVNSSYTGSLGTTTGNVAGVVGEILCINWMGNNYNVTVDHVGNMGVRGNLYAIGNLTYTGANGTAANGNLIFGTSGWGGGINTFGVQSTGTGNQLFSFSGAGSPYMSVGMDGGLNVGSNSDPGVGNIVASGGVTLNGATTAPQGSFSCANWYRSDGSTGWYNSTYQGGWYMSDSTWLRSYNNKSVTAPMFAANQGVSFGAANGYSFNGDGGFDTGMFSNADGDLRFYANGVEIMGNSGVHTGWNGAPCWQANTGSGNAGNFWWWGTSGASIQWNKSNGAGEVNFANCWNSGGAANGNVGFDWWVNNNGTGSQVGYLERNGNMVVLASYYANSLSSLKKAIRPMEHSALEILRNTEIVHFQYRHEEDDAELRTGFIAEKTHSLMTGRDGARFDFMAVDAVTIKAVQELEEMLEQERSFRKTLEQRIAALETHLNLRQEA